MLRTQGWQRRLKRRWKTLHKGIYIALLLVLLHLFWVSKASLASLVVYSLIAVLLIATRFHWAVFNKRLSVN